MNDQRFFDLAMKVIASHATEADRAELNTLLAREPELKAEFERLQADARLAKEALPLVGATQAITGELPSYARERLQTKVRRALGGPTAEKGPDRSLAFGWRWVLGLAATAALVLLAASPMFRTASPPVIQVAMLDTMGGTRGTQANDVALLQTAWKGSSIQKFSSASELAAWEKDRPTNSRQPAAKIIYDPAAGEIRVAGRAKGKAFERTFPIEGQLAATLENAKMFIRQQTAP